MVPIARTALAAGISIASLFAGMASSESAVVPRISEGQCESVATNSGGTGYVVVDPSTNTSCVVKANGTFVWSNKVNACVRKPVRFQGSLKANTRGDMAGKVKVRYVRGNKTITKWVKLKPNKSFSARQKFPSAGTWTAVFSHRGKAITTKVRVAGC